MDCPEFLGRHADWRDGLVSAPRERRRFERHLARCTRCAGYDSAVRRGVLALQSIATIEPSPDFRRRLDARLARERVAVAEPALSPRAGFAAALCLAAAVALLAIEGASGARARAGTGTPELPPVIFPKPVAQAGVPLVTFHDPRASVLGGNRAPYGTALVQPASAPLAPGGGR
jgi:hypothetical protein